jgi:RHS repeat-associated protein
VIFNRASAAKATDDKGAVTTSAARSITVTAAPPTISLTSPTEGQSFTAPASISLAVSVTPGSGTITKVEYFRGATLIGTVTTAPYSYTWTDVPAGNYTLTAKATNSNNGTTTSAARSITVEGTTVSGNVYYIHSDHLDTPREITNEQNQTVWKNPPLTEPFGSTPVDDDPDGDGQAFTFNLRFPGQYYDQETGTHYNYYRDNYLPDFGRYGQSDPIGLTGGINTYAYVRGNPLRRHDRWGLITKPGDDDIPVPPFEPGTCGSGWSDIIVPDSPFGFPFSDCCQAHDNCYGDRCQAPTKVECDDRFHECMQKVCENYYFMERTFCDIMADTYRDGVSGYWGQKAFDEARGIIRPTPEDVQKAIERQNDHAGRLF